MRRTAAAGRAVQRAALPVSPKRRPPPRHGGVARGPRAAATAPQPQQPHCHLPCRARPSRLGRPATRVCAKISARRAFNGARTPMPSPARTLPCSARSGTGARDPSSVCQGVIRMAQRVLHTSPSVAEPERLLGRFGEVEFAPGHVRPTVDHPHLHGAIPVAKRDRACRTAASCWRRPSSCSSARRRTPAHRRRHTRMPPRGDTRSGAPATASAEIGGVAGEAQSHPLAASAAWHVAHAKAPAASRCGCWRSCSSRACRAPAARPPVRARSWLQRAGDRARVVCQHVQVGAADRDRDVLWGRAQTGQVGRGTTG